jgi:hypothetical protein
MHGIASHNCLQLSCHVGLYTGGFSCNCNLARLLVMGGAIGAENLGVHNLDPAQKNRAFASYFSLQLGFRHFQAFGDFVLTAVVPPPRLALRQHGVQVPQRGDRP